MTDDVFPQFPQLESDRLILKEFKPEFWKDIFTLLSDERVSEHETREPFIKLSQAEQYVKARLFITRERREGIIWAISRKEEDDVIGDIGYAPHHKLNAEIGFKLQPAYWNQGLMTEAVLIVVQFLFTETETLRIEAMTRPKNYGSIKVLEKCGFQKEGILRKCEHHQGESWDMGMYSLLKEEFDVNANP
jgi:[ribosomal protein S5]-alanine N-acetyltransferase